MEKAKVQERLEFKLFEGTCELSWVTGRLHATSH